MIYRYNRPNVNVDIDAHNQWQWEINHGKRPQDDPLPEKEDKMDSYLTELVSMFKDLIRRFDLVVKKSHEGHPYTNEITEDDIVNIIDWMKSDGFIITKEKK